MFKWLFCKHEYEFYNTKVEYPVFSTWGYNAFQFVCPKCGCEETITEREIRDRINELTSDYHRSIALGGQHIESSNLVVPRHANCDILYSSPAVTLMLQHYKDKGIDLRQIDKQNKKPGYSHAEG